MDFHIPLDDLKHALLRPTLNDDDMKDSAKVQKARKSWKEREVVFHSRRQYSAARMADQVESRKAMLATGHRDKAVFDAYADHMKEQTFGEVRSVAIETFERLLPFNQKRKDTALTPVSSAFIL